MESIESEGVILLGVALRSLWLNREKVGTAHPTESVSQERLSAISSQFSVRS